MLNKAVFHRILNFWDTPVIDMFASRLYSQLPKYVSWKPDPDAEFVDAFSINWSDIYFYAFPTFSLIPHVVTKLREDQVECILVAPIWLTQSWFTIVMDHLTQTPYIIPVDKTTLTLPGT